MYGNRRNQPSSGFNLSKDLKYDQNVSFRNQNQQTNVGHNNSDNQHTFTGINHAQGTYSQFNNQQTYVEISTQKTVVPQLFLGPNASAPQTFTRPNTQQIFSGPNAPQLSTGPITQQEYVGPNILQTFMEPNTQQNFVGQNSLQSLSGPNTQQNFPGPNIQQRFVAPDTQETLVGLNTPQQFVKGGELNSVSSSPNFWSKSGGYAYKSPRGKIPVGNESIVNRFCDRSGSHTTENNSIIGRLELGLDNKPKTFLGSYGYNSGETLNTGIRRQDNIDMSNKSASNTQNYSKSITRILNEEDMTKNVQNSVPTTCIGSPVGLGRFLTGGTTKPIPKEIIEKLPPTVTVSGENTISIPSSDENKSVVIVHERAIRKKEISPAGLNKKTKWDVKTGEESTKPVVNSWCKNVNIGMGRFLTGNLEILEKTSVIEEKKNSSSTGNLGKKDETSNESINKVKKSTFSTGNQVENDETSKSINKGHEVNNLEQSYEEFIKSVNVPPKEKSDDELEKNINAGGPHPTQIIKLMKSLGYSTNPELLGNSCQFLKDSQKVTPTPPSSSTGPSEEKEPEVQNSDIKKYESSNKITIPDEKPSTSTVSLKDTSLKQLRSKQRKRKSKSAEKSPEIDSSKKNKLTDTQMLKKRKIKEKVNKVLHGKKDNRVKSENLPGGEGFSTYVDTLELHCKLQGWNLPSYSYSRENEKNGHYRCKVQCGKLNIVSKKVFPSKVEGRACLAYDTLRAFGYLKDHKFTFGPIEQHDLKSKLKDKIVAEGVANISKDNEEIGDDRNQTEGVKKIQETSKGNEDENMSDDKSQMVADDVSKVTEDKESDDIIGQIEEINDFIVLDEISDDVEEGDDEDMILLDAVGETVEKYMVENEGSGDGKCIQNTGNNSKELIVIDSSSEESDVEGKIQNNKLIENVSNNEEENCELDRLKNDICNEVITDSIVDSDLIQTNEDKDHITTSSDDIVTMGDDEEKDGKTTSPESEKITNTISDNDDDAVIADNDKNNILLESEENTDQNSICPEDNAVIADNAQNTISPESKENADQNILSSGDDVVIADNDQNTISPESKENANRNTIYSDDAVIADNDQNTISAKSKRNTDINTISSDDAAVKNDEERDQNRISIADTILTEVDDNTDQNTNNIAMTENDEKTDHIAISFDESDTVENDEEKDQNTISIDDTIPIEGDEKTDQNNISTDDIVMTEEDENKDHITTFISSDNQGSVKNDGEGDPNTYFTDDTVMLEDDENRHSSDKTVVVQNDYEKGLKALSTDETVMVGNKEKAHSSQMKTDATDKKEKPSDIKEAKLTIAKNMLKSGIDKSTIVTCTGLTSDDIVMLEKQEVIKAEKLSIAKNMLKTGIDIVVVASCTGLSVDEISKDNS